MSPFFCKKGEVFCSIERGTCELCGSVEGLLKPPYPVLEYGKPYELARAKFPYAVSCICWRCRDFLILYEQKQNHVRKIRQEFADAEDKRREKLGLCWKCGGAISRSNPCMIYEGTYETTHRCNHCGWEESFT
jgi:hypothetical protein